MAYIKNIYWKHVWTLLLLVTLVIGMKPVDQKLLQVSLSMVSISTFLPLSLVLVFRSNKRPKLAMRCSDGNIYKDHNEQPKVFACFGFWDRTDAVSKTRTSNEKQQKATNGKWKHSPKTKTRYRMQQRAFFIPIFIHSRQFLTAGRWLTSKAMKDQKEQERATKCSKEQQKTIADIVVENPNHSKGNQNEQQSAKKLRMEIRLQCFGV